MSTLATKSSATTLIPWKKLDSQAVFKLSPKSKAGVVMGADGSPQLFIFDTSAMLDMLSTIDESLANRVSHEDYHSRSVNPAGWLIDVIESQLPLSEEFTESLRSAIDDAEKKGWVSFDDVKAELKFA